MSWTHLNLLTIKHKILNCLDNKSGGPDRDRTDDLLHAMQACQQNRSNLISNTLNFHLAEWTFTSFTQFIRFHETIGGNLGEDYFALPSFESFRLAFSISNISLKFKTISHIKTTSKHDLGGDNGQAIYRRS